MFVKRVLLLSFIGLMVSLVQAQEKKFQRSDIELLNFGVAFGATDFGDYIAHPGVFLNFEYRYHIKPLPLNFGIQFSQTGIPRALDGENTSDADQIGRCMLVADYISDVTTRLILSQGLVLVGIMEWKPIMISGI